MNDQRRWASWDQYLSLHESYLRRWDHFIIADRLVREEAPTLVRWKGVLVCAGMLEIRVNLIVDVELQRGRPHVRTRKYSYHVLRRIEGIERGLFRYDNAHVPDWHHRHAYDRDGREIRPPEAIDQESSPTLGDVLFQTYGVWEEMQRSQE